MLYIIHYYLMYNCICLTLSIAGSFARFILSAYYNTTPTLRTYQWYHIRNGGTLI